MTDGTLLAPVTRAMPAPRGATARCSVRVGLSRAAAVALFMAACSGSLVDPNAGAGGTTGGGATGGAGGGGGADAGGRSGGGPGGRGGGGALQLPGCVADLLASCPPEGTCNIGITDAGVLADACFASGVHASFTSVENAPGCRGGATRVTRVTKPDGSPCYSFESYADPDMACTGFRFTWKDASGQVVATGIFNPDTTPNTMVTCTRSDETLICNRPIPGGASSAQCIGISDFGTLVLTATQPAGSAGCVPPSSGQCAPLD
jgi:hypothetical protein